MRQTQDSKASRLRAASDTVNLENSSWLIILNDSLKCVKEGELTDPAPEPHEKMSKVDPLGSNRGRFPTLLR